MIDNILAELLKERGFQKLNFYNGWHFDHELKINNGKLLIGLTHLDNNIVILNWRRVPVIEHGNYEYRANFDLTNPTCLDDITAAIDIIVLKNDHLLTRDIFKDQST